MQTSSRILEDYATLHHIPHRDITLAIRPADEATREVVRDERLEAISRLSRLAVEQGTYTWVDSLNSAVQLTNPVTFYGSANMSCWAGDGGAAPCRSEYPRTPPISAMMRVMWWVVLTARQVVALPGPAWPCAVWKM